MPGGLRGAAGKRHRKKPAASLLGRLLASSVAASSNHCSRFEVQDRMVYSAEIAERERRTGTRQEARFGRFSTSTSSGKRDCLKETARGKTSMGCGTEGGQYEEQARGDSARLALPSVEWKRSQGTRIWRKLVVEGITRVLLHNLQDQWPPRNHTIGAKPWQRTRWGVQVARRRR